MTNTEKQEYTDIIKMLRERIEQLETKNNGLVAKVAILQLEIANHRK